MKKVLIGAVIASLVLMSCGSGGQEIASVNGKKITMADLNAEIESLPAQYKMMAQSPEMKKRILDNLVVTELLIQQAEKEGMLSNPEIQNKIKEQELGIKSEVEAQLSMLRHQKKNANKIAVREVVIKEMLGTRDYSDVNVGDKEIRESYDQYVKSMKSSDPGAKVEKFSKIKEDIRKSIARQRWVENLRSGADIKIDDSAVSGGMPELAPGSGVEIVPPAE